MKKYVIYLVILIYGFFLSENIFSQEKKFIVSEKSFKIRKIDKSFYGIFHRIGSKKDCFVYKQNKKFTLLKLTCIIDSINTVDLSLKIDSLGYKIAPISVGLIFGKKFKRFNNDYKVIYAVGDLCEKSRPNDEYFLQLQAWEKWFVSRPFINREIYLGENSWILVYPK